MQEIPGPSSGSNTRYSMEQIGMAVFSVFFTQSPSFLSHQRSMQLNKGSSNAPTLFGMGENITTDNHIRKQLDHLSPSHLFPLNRQVFEWLSEHNRLDHFCTLNGQLLVTIDGTQYHSSNAIDCDQCCCKTTKDGKVHYSHTVVTPVVVSPGIPYVLPLERVFIVPQDSHKKQNCETAAAKRWLQQQAGVYAQQKVTILGDDLYSRTPLCRDLLSNNFNFLLVCKPSSHKNLYEWVEEMDHLSKVSHLEIKRRKGKKVEIDHYRWLNQAPLYDTKDPLLPRLINWGWCELVTKDEDVKVIYHNGFVTNHIINDANIEEMILAGRARWKVENENNNTLKTKGYHLTRMALS
jgi:hypothetical protein